MQQIPPDSRMREETNFIGFTCAIFDLHYTPCYFGSHPIQKDENDRNEEAQQLQISEILVFPMPTSAMQSSLMDVDRSTSSPF
ncbi:hypothetical protein RB195_012333 [Necator americanus]|uniref:Uncharacterized protein n=1 Tax=Necator americanus TaxID=51031 RepID=A0ABR1D847_NECAM